MNQFLDQILNPIPARKKIVQTSINANDYEMTKNMSNGIQKAEELKFDEERGQQTQQNEKYDDYEQQEVTEQMVFDHCQGHQFSKSSKMQNSYSQGVLREVRKVKIVNGGYKRFEELESNQSFPEDTEIQTEPNIIEAQFAFQNDKKAEQIRRAISSRIVEELIEGINSTKEVQRQFLLWFSKEKSSFSKLIKILQTQFNNKIKQVVQRMRQQNRFQAQKARKSQQILPQGPQKPSPLSTKQRLQIQKKLIKQELEQRYLYRIQKLEQQLQSKRKNQQQEIPKNNQQNSNLISEIQRLNEDLEIFKFQLNQKNTLIAQLQMENQKLNQHIFDVQQQISGIQLEVENKVREKIKQFEQENFVNQPQTLNPILQASSQLQQSSRAIGPQPSQINSQRIDEFININEILKQKLQSIQFEKDQFENQLKEHEKILSFREQQIQKNQQDINFEWQDIEKQKQSLLQREQQLIIAEENISKKISQIKYKQAQFQKWQAQLHTRQVNFDMKDQEFNKKLQELVERQNIFKFEKQKFLKEKQLSSGFLNNTKSKNCIQQFNVQSVPFKPNDTYTHQLPLTRKYYQEPDIKHQRSFDNQYQFKNRQDEIKYNIQRSYEEDKSYTRQNRERERSIFTGNNCRPHSRQGHLFVLPQNNSRLQNQSRSQSRSKEKIQLRSNILPNSVLSGGKNAQFKSNIRFSDEIIQTKQSSNLDGLGSKLQKLRDEIKREIDSIK